MAVTARHQERTEAVIVGAGPAGLAVGACLQRAGVPFVILEKEGSVGSSWRGHYERLHLHTDKARSALPFCPFPKHYPRYPSRHQVVEYLESYASRFELEPRLGQEVVRAGRVAKTGGAGHSGDEWETTTADGVYRSRHLVVCSGHNREPIIPSWPGMHDFRGRLLHACQYRNGGRFEGKRVLVVGFGNSGAEIALDLHEHGANPVVAVRSPVNVIPRELLGMPIMALVIPLDLLPARLADAATSPILRHLYRDLRRWGLARPDYGPFEQVARYGRIPLIDVGALNGIERGEIEVRGEIERFLEGGVLFTEGNGEEFDAVVLATGYRPGYEGFLPETKSSRSLHFCGFNVVATGMLREIAREAKRIAARIASSPGRRAHIGGAPAISVPGGRGKRQYR